MSGTAFDEVELIIEDVDEEDVTGNHGGKPPSRDGDDGGGDEGGSGGSAPEPHRSKLEKHSTAVLLAMLSIVMLFAVLTAAFVSLRFNNPHIWVGIRLPRILWANTVVLLASSATLELARRKLDGNDRIGFRRLWGLTTCLGLLFVAGQVAAWRQLAAQGTFDVSRVASSFFYVFTGLHAAHLLAGICALLYVQIKRFDVSRVSRPVAAQAASYYWHFMDGLWLVVLAVLYLGR